jgi:microcystin-dependent protein
MAVQFLQRKNDVDISRLTAETSAANDDLVYLEKGTGTGDKRRKITFTNLLSSVTAGIVNSIVPTGIVVPWVSSTAPSGWIFLYGGTIGSATSGATGRANADTANLYALLWGSFLNSEIPIQDSAGTPTTRGASAAADFSANKRLPIPDLRGRSVFGFDSTGSRVNVARSGINSAVFGATGGADTIVLVGDNIPGHTHTVTVTYPSQPNVATIENANIALDGSDTILTYGDPNTVTPSSAGFTTSSTGSATAVNKMPPTIILPWIIKL